MQTRGKLLRAVQGLEKGRMDQLKTCVGLSLACYCQGNGFAGCLGYYSAADKETENQNGDTTFTAAFPPLSN